MKPRLIKRYSNRRLYDTQESRTLTLADLAGLVQKGIEVKVIDSKTNEDITLSVLGRVLLAEAESWRDIKKSKDLFTHIISLGGEKSMSMLKNTILASIGALQITKNKAEKLIDDLIKRGELDKSQRKNAIMELLDKAEKSTASLRDRISKEAGKVGVEVSKAVKKLNLARTVDLKRLEQKVDRIGKAIKKLESKLNT